MSAPAVRLGDIGMMKEATDGIVTKSIPEIIEELELRLEGGHREEALDLVRCVLETTRDCLSTLRTQITQTKAQLILRHANFPIQENGEF